MKSCNREILHRAKDYANFKTRNIGFGYQRETALGFETKKFGISISRLLSLLSYLQTESYIFSCLHILHSALDFPGEIYTCKFNQHTYPERDRETDRQ